jgi:hypothetical protein
MNIGAFTSCLTPTYKTAVYLKHHTPQVCGVFFCLCSEQV